MEQRRALSQQGRACCERPATPDRLDATRADLVRRLDKILAEAADLPDDECRRKAQPNRLNK
jgi:hypothetical protein